jgi:quinol-cytochrome oxidoreductase complex cytochrome b subunit
MSRMLRVFDTVLVDPLFEKNDLGETIYYPSGVFGRGRVVPEDRLASLRQAARWLGIFTIAATSSVIVLLRRIDIPGAVGWLIFACSFVLLLGFISYFRLWLAADLEPSSSPDLPMRERLRRARAARPPWWHWIILLFGASNLLLAVAGLASGSADMNWVIILAAAVLWLPIGAALTLEGVLGIIESLKPENMR